MTDTTNTNSTGVKPDEAQSWPELILTVRGWFEGNPDAALAELEHRARNDGLGTNCTEEGRGEVK